MEIVGGRVANLPSPRMVGEPGGPGGGSFGDDGLFVGRICEHVPDIIG